MVCLQSFLFVGLALLFASGSVIGCDARANAAVHPTFTRLLELRDESVFAYSRISPNGRFLVYSSERTSARRPGYDGRMLYVYDLVDRSVVFTDSGIDGYWSPDGKRLVYKMRREKKHYAAIWDSITNGITADVIPVELGDYYSWGKGEHGETLLTIDGWYAQLDGINAGQPRRMQPCPEIGRGDRPLISRDGIRASIFVKDEVVIRNVRDCGGIKRTGIVGGKADWSPDGRYLAFHSPKSRGSGYEIKIVDVLTNKQMSLEGLTGSSYFPSWADDFGLVFRYDGPDYAGFIRADSVIRAKLSAAAAGLNYRVGFQGDWITVLPKRGRAIILVWAGWGAHSVEALYQFSEAEKILSGALNSAFITAYDPTSRFSDVATMVTASGFAGPVVQAPWRGMATAGGFNQTPTYLAFNNGCLVGRALGSISRARFESWATEAFGTGDGVCEATP